ncbi:MAG: hypothetical protein ABI954_15585 [Pyrinomonadaceae bacterium]
MEKQLSTVGERVEKFCVSCEEELGHVVETVTKAGKISRVSCSQCGIRGTFKSGTQTNSRPETIGTSEVYDRYRTYRTGQKMMHPTFGVGKVTKLIESQMIDVLFADRLRRLIHSRV